MIGLKLLLFFKKAGVQDRRIWPESQIWKPDLGFYFLIHALACCVALNRIASGSFITALVMSLDRGDCTWTDSAMGKERNRGNYFSSRHTAAFNMDFTFLSVDQLCWHQRPKPSIRWFWPFPFASYPCMNSRYKISHCACSWGGKPSPKSLSRPLSTA